MPHLQQQVLPPQATASPPVVDAGTDWLVTAADHPDPLLGEQRIRSDQQLAIPIGRTFAVIEAPTVLGLFAVHIAGLLGQSLGPVAAEADRLLILVAPESVEPAAEQLPVRTAAGQDLGVTVRVSGECRLGLPTVPTTDGGPWWLAPPRDNPPYLPDAGKVLRAIVTAASTGDQMVCSNQGVALVPRQSSGPLEPAGRPGLG
jgi:hypothetical protein